MGIPRSAPMEEEAGADKIRKEMEPEDIRAEEVQASGSQDQSVLRHFRRMVHRAVEEEEAREVPEQTRMHRLAADLVMLMPETVDSLERPSTARMVEAEEEERTRQVRDRRLPDRAAEVLGREDSTTKMAMMEWSSSSGRSVKSSRRRRSDD